MHIIFWWILNKIFLFLISQKFFRNQAFFPILMTPFSIKKGWVWRLSRLNKSKVIGITRNLFVLIRGRIFFQKSIEPLIIFLNLRESKDINKLTSIVKNCETYNYHPLRVMLNKCYLNIIVISTEKLSIYIDT